MEVLCTVPRYACMYVLSGFLHGDFYGPICTVVAIYTWNSFYVAFQDVALNSDQQGKD